MKMKTINQLTTPHSKLAEEYEDEKTTILEFSVF